MKNINEIKGTLLSNKQMKDLKGGMMIAKKCTDKTCSGGTCKVPASPEYGKCLCTKGLNEC